jgi:hypothetical protein
MLRILAAVAVLLVFPVALSFAQTPTVSTAQPLADSQLDGITAGTDEVGDSGGSGGAIVGNSSNATIKTSGEVVLEGAQEDARALNLVNAAESGIANGVNVWDGRLESQTAETRLNVDQENFIVQRQARSASVPEYVRPEANIDESFESTRDVTTNGSVSTVTEVLGQSIQGGQGISGSGSLDLELTGGSIEISNNVHVEVEGGADIDLLGGLFSGSADTSATFDTTQTLTWVLPELSFHAEGSVCAVAMGSCEAEGTDSSTSSGTRIVRSPFALYGAQAEHIVVDDSTLVAESNYTVLLADGAQAGARAMNLVNAAGSVVANAVNVSRTPTVGPVLNLNQVNTIIQAR